MDAVLELKLSLLRGESPCPMDMADFGRLSSIQLHTQTKPAFSDRLAITMLGMIASGRLPPGSRLPPERRIAEMVSASRVCVRSALDRLKLGGYIQAVQGSGTRVASLEDSDRLAQLMRANAENLDDLRDFVAFLDRCVVERLTRTASRHTLTRCADRISALDRNADPGRFGTAEAEIRIDLAAACDSPVYGLITTQLARGIGSLFQSVAGIAPTPTRESYRESRERLSAALRARDIDGARDALDTCATLLRQVDHASPTAMGDGFDPEAITSLDLSVATPEQLRERLARVISGMIATGVAGAGSRLLSERQLAHLFGVSRASVRQALATLKSAGTIVADERCGTRIAETKTTLATLAASNLDHLQTMCRLRGYLEVWAARRAATRASDQDLADLRKIMIEMGRSQLSARRRIDLDMRLHLTIARAAGNAVHLYITEILRDLMTAYFDYSLSEPSIAAGRDAMLLAHHHAIVDAIVRRDAAGAERAMSEHCGAFSDRYEAVG